MPSSGGVPYPPSPGATKFLREDGTFVIPGGGGGGGTVTSVTAGAGLTDTGTATDPVINVANADGSLTIGANDTAVSATVQAGAAAGATAVQPARQVIAGAGLTGGGTLAADRTFNVAAADGTVIVNADSIQVGIISDVNVDDTIITEETFDTGVKKLRRELQHVRLLLATLVDLELTNG